jgi:hypothetical protein
MHGRPAKLRPGVQADIKRSQPPQHLRVDEPHATMISRNVATAKNPQLAAPGGQGWMKFIP